MKTNVGKVDRWIRIVAGVALLSLLVLLNGWERWLGLIGLVFLVTGIVRVCPIYYLFKINTAKK